LIEKRTEERYRVSVKVLIEVQSAHGLIELEGKQIQCKTKDISLMGMCLHTEKQLPVNALLILSVELGTPIQTFNHTGQIMWSAVIDNGNVYEIGIHLTEHLCDVSLWRNFLIQTLAA
jgi:hypothetical protein